MTQVFSYHNCSGMIGSAIAPVTLLYMQALVGWRAPLGAALLGVVRRAHPRGAARAPAVRPLAAKPLPPDGEGAGWRPAPPALAADPAQSRALSRAVHGRRRLNQYLVVGLEALHGTPPVVANTALTGLLTLSAIGVLIGGMMAGRTSRHNLVTATGLSVTCAVTAFVATFDPGAVLLVLVLSVSGFASGMAIPSRDMIVRSATPPGSFGKVFGFVTTGLHIGGSHRLINSASSSIAVIRAGCSCSSPPVRWSPSPRFVFGIRGGARRERARNDSCSTPEA